MYGAAPVKLRKLSVKFSVKILRVQTHQAHDLWSCRVLPGHDDCATTRLKFFRFNATGKSIHSTSHQLPVCFEVLKTSVQKLQLVPSRLITDWLSAVVSVFQTLKARSEMSFRVGESAAYRFSVDNGNTQWPSGTSGNYLVRRGKHRRH